METIAQHIDRNDNLLSLGAKKEFGIDIDSFKTRMEKRLSKVRKILGKEENGANILPSNVNANTNSIS